MYEVKVEGETGTQAAHKCGGDQYLLAFGEVLLL
jgi:hypothetical protein